MPQDQAAYWRNLKQQAVDGQLRLEEDLGQAMADVVSRYITELEKQKVKAGRLQFLSGWGGLPSAVTLQQKFERKAEAGSPEDSDDSAIKRLDQHIAIARDQRDTFLAAIGKLAATDQQSADTIGSSGA